MWENWQRDEIVGKQITYTLLLPLKIEGTAMVIELTAFVFRRSDVPEEWEVIFSAFHPSTGENIVLEKKFSSLREAESAAWEQAQKSIELRRAWMI
jgi:hypothetical protein